MDEMIARLRGSAPDRLSRHDKPGRSERWTRGVPTRPYLYNLREVHRQRLRHAGAALSEGTGEGMHRTSIAPGSAPGMASTQQSHERRLYDMDNRMINQRPSDDQPGREERGLSRWEEPRRLSKYGAWTSPFELMRRFSEDVDRLFESFGFPRFGWPFESTERALARPTGGTTATAAWTPSVEVFARGDDLVVRADLPGVKPEDVSVEAEDNNLIIRGETRAEHERQEEGYYYSERQYGSFYRSIPLPQGVRADNAQATFNNGVLEITLPGAARAVQPQRRRIQIQGARPEVPQPQTGTTETARQAEMGTQATGSEQPHITT